MWVVEAVMLQGTGNMQHMPLSSRKITTWGSQSRKSLRTTRTNWISRDNSDSFWSFPDGGFTIRLDECEDSCVRASVTQYLSRVHINLLKEPPTKYFCAQINNGAGKLFLRKISSLTVRCFSFLECALWLSSIIFEKLKIAFLPSTQNIARSTKSEFKSFMPSFPEVNEQKWNAIYKNISIQLDSQNKSNSS